MVIADSGSTDRTHSILEEMTSRYPKLVILSDTGKQHGPKVIALYKYAISQKADYVFQTDSDDQTDPAEFGGFWERRRKYSAILGCRKKRGDGLSRALVENVVCRLLHIYFGVRVPDANAPFRLMRTDVIAKYIDRLPEDYALPNIMMTAFFAYFHERKDSLGDLALCAHYRDEEDPDFIWSSLMASGRTSLPSTRSLATKPIMPLPAKSSLSSAKERVPRSPML